MNLTECVNKEPCARRILGFLIGLYVAFFFTICSLKFNSFAYYDFDLAVHDQVLWNIGHGSIFSSILGIEFLGNHSHLISFLLAPFYKIFPHPLTLLFLQALALGLGAWPLYLLTRTRLNSFWGLVVAGSYLIYPGLGYTNLFEFHPTVFATLFLLWMLFYFHAGRFGLFALFAALAMLCQENIALAVMMMGFYALWKRKDRRWVLFSFLVAGFYFWLSVKVIMPAFNKNTIQFLAIYNHLGVTYADIVSNICRHPLQVCQIIGAPHKISFLVSLVFPLTLIPLLDPLTLAIAGPFFMQHLLSLRASEVSLYYHYTAEIIPFIFVAFVFGLGRLLSIKRIRERPIVLAGLLLLVAVGSNVHWGPHVRLFREWSSLVKDDWDKMKDDFLKEVPGQAPVVTTFEFLPRLTHRSGLYSFHHVYTGSYTLSNKAYRLPEDVNLALLDFNDMLTFKAFYQPQGYKNIQHFLSDGGWGVSDVRDTIVLFQKNSPDKFSLYDILPSEPKPQYPMRGIVNQDIEFLGFDLKEIREPVFQMTFYWHCLRKTDKDINVFFDVLNQDHRQVLRLFRPVCYRIYPTQGWEPGQWIREERYLVLPSSLKPGPYTLMMGFYDYRSQELYAADPRDPLGRVVLAQIDKK